MGNCYNKTQKSTRDTENSSIEIKNNYTEGEVKEITTFNKHFTREMYGYICSIYDAANIKVFL